MESRLGKYQLVQRLAVGGMAELFLARASAKHGFEKTVVLKQILPAYAENPNFISMFMTEAQLAAGLHHPNIAQVYDFGEEDGTFFFAMEYVHGRDLRQVMSAASDARVGLPLAQVLHIVIGITAGLHHAHEQRDDMGNPLGIVHRDVSPSNVLVTYEGNVKIVDFGIAKAASLGPGTVAGELKGKIAYMSPEQCRGELVDRRSDVFSIGTLLWELTVGRRLFRTAGREITLLHRVEQADVPLPSSLVETYPVALEEIVMKALARNRDDRFDSALQLRSALEDFAHRAHVPLSSTRVGELMEGLFPADDRTPPPLGGSLPGLRRPSGPTSPPARTESITPTPGPSYPSPSPMPRTVVTSVNEQQTLAGVPGPVGASAPSTQPEFDEFVPQRRWPVWIAATVVVLVGLSGALFVILDRTEPETATETAVPSPPTVQASAVPSSQPVAPPPAEQPAAVPPPPAAEEHEAEDAEHPTAAPSERTPTKSEAKPRPKSQSGSKPPRAKPPKTKPKTKSARDPLQPNDSEPEAKPRSSDVFLPRRGQESKKGGFL